MTGAEFYNEFNTNYDRMSNDAAPGIEPYEISVFLTEAMYRLIKSYYQGKTNLLKKGFEQTEKRRKDLSELITSTVNTSNVSTTILSSDQSGAHRNSYFYDLPDDFWLTIEESVLSNVERCDITQPSTSIGEGIIIGDQVLSTIYTRIPVVPKTHDEYNSNIKNPYTKPGTPAEDPDDAVAWRLDFSHAVGATPKRHEIVTDGSYSILQYYARYLRKPPPIIVEDIAPYTINSISVQTDCILDSMFHPEIVQEAVSIALETVKDDRWQTQKVESTVVE